MAETATGQNPSERRRLKARRFKATTAMLAENRGHGR